MNCDQVEDDRAVGERLQQPGVRAPLEGLLAGELGHRLGQLALEPLLLCCELLEPCEPLGVIAAVGGGQQQPGELAADVAPGLDGPAGGGVGPGQVEEGGLAALEHAGDGRLAAPDPGIGRPRRSRARGGETEIKPSRIAGKLGQVVQRLGLGGGGQEDLGQICCMSAACWRKGQASRVAALRLRSRSPRLFRLRARSGWPCGYRSLG